MSSFLIVLAVVFGPGSGFGGPGGGFFRTGSSSGLPLLLPVLKPPPGPPKPLPGSKTTARTIRNEPGQLETSSLYIFCCMFFVYHYFSIFVVVGIVRLTGFSFKIKRTSLVLDTIFCCGFFDRSYYRNK